jgi:hypothetical protein
MIKPAGGRYALVVATAEYEDPKLRRLRSPTADAKDLAAVLGDPAKGDFEVSSLINPSHARATRAIAGYFSDRRPGDLLLLHVSCHGIKDEHGDLFLAAADTDLALLSATGIPATWLSTQISRSRAGRTVLLLDCCFSGAFPLGMQPRGESVDAREPLQGRGRVVITASSALEYSFEGDRLTGKGSPSVFTEAVVEGLKTGMADLDGDGLISVDDLYEYVYERVRERTPAQTPSRFMALEGPVYLARSAYQRVIEPATLDPELIARTEDRYAGIREGAANELARLLASSNPAVVLAARQALQALTEDDSKRVSSAARAALDAVAQPELAPNGTSRGGLGAVASSLRRHVRPVIAAAVIALGAGAALAKLVSGSEHQAGHAAPSLQALSALRARWECASDRENQWMVTLYGARQQLVCADVSSATKDTYLSFGRWPTSRNARSAIPAITATERNCKPGTMDALRAILPNTACFHDDHPGFNRGVHVTWTYDGSRVLGFFSLNNRHDEDALIAAWKKVVRLR